MISEPYISAVYACVCVFIYFLVCVCSRAISVVVCIVRCLAVRAQDNGVNMQCIVMVLCDDKYSMMVLIK